MKSVRAIDSNTPSPLMKGFRTYIHGLTAISDYPEVKRYFETWLDHRERPWMELSELCYRIAGGSNIERLERVFSGWMILFAVSGPLDDYVDQDKTPDAWQKLGRDVGTFIALSLIAEALTIVLGSDELFDVTLGKAAGVLASHLKDASLGQAQDADGISTLEDYERMLELKAASLVAALTEAVAVTAEAELNLRLAMRNFGRELGMAIQIVNDYLGIWRPDEIAKDSGGDLNEQKLTYPILYALNVDNPRSVEFRKLLEESPGKRNCEQMLEILNELGAPEFILSAIYVRRTRAINQIEGWASQEDINQLEQWFDEHLLGKKA